MKLICYYHFELPVELLCQHRGEQNVKAAESRGRQDYGDFHLQRIDTILSRYSTETLVDAELLRHYLIDPRSAYPELPGDLSVRFLGKMQGQNSLVAPLQVEEAALFIPIQFHYNFTSPSGAS